MDGIIYQHIISYPNNCFCIEGTWKADLSNSNDENNTIVKSPPIRIHDKTFFLSFNFFDSKDLFMIYIDIENISCDSYPVSVNCLMKNKVPAKSLYGEAKLFFTQQSKHGIINFGNFYPKEVFSDEDFAPDNFFIIEFKISHQDILIKPNQKYPTHVFNISELLNYRRNLFRHNPFTHHYNFFLNDNNFNQNSMLDVLTPSLNQFQKNPSGYCGLYNQGATCYLNSMLQSLYHIAAFKSLVYQISFNAKNQSNLATDMIYNLQKLFSEMDKSDSAASTKELTTSFGWTSEESFRQHDIQELLRVFLEAISQKLKHMHQANNQNKNEQQENNEPVNCQNENIANEISDLFKFRVEQLIQCPQVGFTNGRIDDYLDLTVEVRGCQNLYQSLKKFTMPEKLEEPYKTDEYGPQEAIMLSKFISLPKVLFIHLKRFEYTNNPNANAIGNRLIPIPTLNKINDRFEFPIVFDFGEFIDGNQRPNNTNQQESHPVDLSNENNIEQPVSISKENNIEQPVDLSNENNLEKTQNEIHHKRKESKWTYELFGVLVHSGNATFGHYFVYLRLPPENKWFKFNDSHVIECSESEAVFHNYGNGISQTNGYMLIYLRKQDIPDLFTQNVPAPIQIIEEKFAKPSQTNKKELVVENKNLDENGNLLKSTINKSANDMVITIYTDSDLQNYSDECAIFSNNVNTKDDCKRFTNSAVVILPDSSTCRDLLKRIYSMYFSNDSDKLNDDNELNTLEVYKINENETKTLILASDQQLSGIHQKVDVFLRTPIPGISATLQINSNLPSLPSMQLMPILNSDENYEIAIKKTYNAVAHLSYFGKSVMNQLKSIAYDSVEYAKSLTNSHNSADNIFLFLKVFDYKLQKIVFLKSIRINQKDLISILFKDASAFYYPEDEQIHDSFVFYKQISKTHFVAIDSHQSFEINCISNGCIILIENINENVDRIQSNEFLAAASKNTMFSKDFLQVKTPETSNDRYSVLDYINDKYNLCDAVISSFDDPHKHLFILRFHYYISVFSLKQMVAKSAGFDRYDPSRNSILLYRSYFNNPDMPTHSPLSPFAYISEPIHRLFFYFFDNVPESASKELVTVKVILNKKVRIFFAHPNETILSFKTRQLIPTKLIDSNYDPWLDKGSSLYQIPNHYLIKYVWNSSLRFCQPVKLEQNQKLIPVCHPQGTDMFLPFLLIIHKDEQFVSIKERLFAGLQNYGFNHQLEDVKISIHFLNKSNFDTNRPKQISNSDCLYNFGQPGESPFIFVELRESMKPPKEGVVIKCND